MWYVFLLTAGSGFGQEEGTYHLRTTILPPEEKVKERLHHQLHPYSWHKSPRRWAFRGTYTCSRALPNIGTPLVASLP